MAAASCLLGGQRDEACRQVTQVGALGYEQLETVGFLEHVVAILLAELGEFCIDLAQSRPRGVVQAGACTNELLVRLVQQVPLFR